MAVARSLDVPGLTVSFSPLAFPTIPLLPVVGILIALVPAIAAPNPMATTAVPFDSEPLAHAAKAAVGSRPHDPIGSDLSGVST
jgi:hypothetical protein